MSDLRKAAVKTGYQAVVGKVKFQKLAEAKVPFVIKHLGNVLKSTDKVVCFCHHREVAKQIHQAFKEESVMLIGETPSDQRQGIVDEFQTRKEVRLFVGNIQAAGIGISLTAASHVVFAEISWVPGEMEQCEDRCHRIGTVDSVLYQFLVMAASVDAAIAMTYVSKQDVIERAVDTPTPYDVEMERMLS